MIRTFVRALLATIPLAAPTGLVNPLALSGLAQLAFRDGADGSLVRVDGRVVGAR